MNFFVAKKLGFRVDSTIEKALHEPDQKPSASRDELPSVFRLPEARGYAAVSFVR
jgi:hypothetical protein